MNGAASQTTYPHTIYNTLNVESSAHLTNKTILNRQLLEYTYDTSDQCTYEIQQHYDKTLKLES